MSISSISAPTPVKPPEASEPKPPVARNDDDAGKSRTPQPTLVAPLPPGQGTRVDQLV